MLNEKMPLKESLTILALSAGVLWFVFRSDDPAPVQAAPIPAHRILAADLGAAYEANPVAADEAYKGKVLSIGGAIISIETTMGGHAYLVVGDPDHKSMFGRRAALVFKDSEKPKIAQLQKGAHVEATCTASGETLKRPSARDCVLTWPRF